MKAYIITALFVLADIVTGCLNAFRQGSLDSRVMREGLFHKLGELLAVVFGDLVGYAQAAIGLGIDAPLATAVAAYIAVMETVSIIENLCGLNPGLCKLFSPYLAKVGNQQENAQAAQGEEKANG